MLKVTNFLWWTFSIVILTAAVKIYLLYFPNLEVETTFWTTSKHVTLALREAVPYICYLTA